MVIVESKVHGAVSIVNAIATGNGATLGIDTFVKTRLETKKGSGIYISSDNKTISSRLINKVIENTVTKKQLEQTRFELDFQSNSLLNIYEATPSIIRQIELAKSLLNKKNCIFGSCWGLQVLVTAAGGKIQKNPNGLEAIVAKNFILNDEGL